MKAVGMREAQLNFQDQSLAPYSIEQEYTQDRVHALSLRAHLWAPPSSDTTTRRDPF